MNIREEREDLLGSEGSKITTTAVVTQYPTELQLQ